MKSVNNDEKVVTSCLTRAVVVVRLASCLDVFPCFPPSHLRTNLRPPPRSRVWVLLSWEVPRASSPCVTAVPWLFLVVARRRVGRAAIPLLRTHVLCTHAWCTLGLISRPSPRFLAPQVFFERRRLKMGTVVISLYYLTLLAGKMSQDSTA